MAGKTAAFAGDLLNLIFIGTAISTIAQNNTTSPITSIYVSLHTADPGEAGTQATNETTYTGYARVAVPRNGSNFSVTGDVLTLLTDAIFGKNTAGTPTITHVGFGTSVSGVGKLLYSGPITPIVMTVNMRPIIEAGSTITEG